MNRRRSLPALFAAAVLALAACGGDDGSSGDTTSPGTAAPDTTSAPTTSAAGGDTSAPTTAGPTTSAGAVTVPASTEPATPAPTDAPATSAAPSGWTVDTEVCADPAAATAPLGDTVRIGTVVPLSNSPAAAAFAPVRDGLQAYIDFANENSLVPGHTLELAVEDDQYNKDLTPGAVSTLIDDGVDLFTGIIGTANNLAVRDTLNAECIPQLANLTGSKAWGDDVEEYPWTTGGLIPYFVETRAYLRSIQSQFPDGATAALFTVASDFGDEYLDEFEAGAEAAGVEIVARQTIDPTDTNPPDAQIGAIAAEEPDVIMAVPLGAQCAQFTASVQAAKAQHPGWEPALYLTNTCASSLILAFAGDTANGIYTSASGGVLDIGDPAVLAANPAAQQYADYMASKGLSDITTAAAGWVIGEVTVATLTQASGSPDGITRASIMEAARDFSFTPTLGRQGVTYTLSGTDDTYAVTDVQVVQYDATAKTFADVGPLMTDLVD